MLNRPRRSATWYRSIVGAGAAIALTAVGAAAMWTGWLPSRPLQWNDINGRLNLGGGGAEIRGDRPIVVNQWPSAGALGYQARADGALAGGSDRGSDRASFAERFARRPDNDDKRSGAMWGSDSRSRLSSTSGRSALGGGAGGHGGGLGTAGGAARVQNSSSQSSPKAAKAAPAAPHSSGRPGSGGSGGGAPAPVPPASENTTTVGDLATGTAGGTGTLDLGFGPGDPIGGGGGSGMAATPQPASLMLIGTGALAVAGLFRRRRK